MVTTSLAVKDEYGRYGRTYSLVVVVVVVVVNVKNITHLRKRASARKTLGKVCE